MHNLFHPVVGEIWMLHRVVEKRSEEFSKRVLEVTPSWLEQKIEDYRQKGYLFVSIDDIPSFLVSGFRHQPFVCLTFDDGYEDTYTHAYPLLKRFGVPFTIYVTTGLIDNGQPLWWYPHERLGIGREELKKLDADPLCTLGAHTVNHPRLEKLNRKQQQDEIGGSKATLENLLGHSVNHFSFPHGAYNDDTLEICKELGFKTAVQSWGGAIRRGTPPWPLPRIEINQP